MIGAAIMIATALLYSGIENPRWTLPADRAAAVGAAIDAMPEIACPTPPLAGLGYTGISLRVEKPDGGEQVWTFANSIAVSEQRCFADAGRKIELMVLQTGRGHIDAALLKTILR